MKRRLLGIDYGSVHIGVALSDETNKIAFGKKTTENNKNMMTELLNDILVNEVGTVVIGYPVSLKGKKTEQTLNVEKFASSLREFLESKKLNTQVVLYDERYTSVIARNSMLEAGMRKSKRKDKKNLDIISATLILQSYIDRHASVRTERAD